uniref:NR LBD domain-containing protein n=1 Tax=Heterorhabditis bacteriophora TaxID=37862 RepID=A0A1I7WXB0_HETBA
MSEIRQRINVIVMAWREVLGDEDASRKECLIQDLTLIICSDNNCTLGNEITSSTNSSHSFGHDSKHLRLMKFLDRTT